MLITDKYDPTINVAISVFEGGELIDQRLSHNVVTNTGRSWLSRIVGASDYNTVVPTPHTHDKIKYIGLGCGGALQTDNDFATGQAELVTVSAVQDPIPFSLDAGIGLYLKQVDNQSFGDVYFPGNFRTRFIVDIAESELSFANNTTLVSQKNVGTSVPITEAGLYLSSASPTYKAAVGNTPEIGSDPSEANHLVAYNIFDPVTITPNVVVRIEWELRF